MPEAITQYAINSTLGTEDFKPLDKIITDGKSLISSDNLYYQIYIGTLGVHAQKDPIQSKQIQKKIKFNVNGTANLKYYLYGYKVGYAVLEIYKNNQLYQTIQGTKYESYVEQPLLTTLIQFNKKDEFYFILKNTSGGGDNTAVLKDLCIYADIMDHSAITIEELE